jgi:hypothetical protein
MTGMGGFVHRWFESLPLRTTIGVSLHIAGFWSVIAASPGRSELPLRAALDRCFGALTGAQLARTDRGRMVV